MEWPIFRGAYVRREICVIKSVGLACSGKEIDHLCFVLLCIRAKIPSTSPPGAYIRRDDLTEGFLRYDFGGLIFGGAYSWRGLFSEFYGIFSLGAPDNVVKSCFYRRRDKCQKPVSDLDIFKEYMLCTAEPGAEHCTLRSCKPKLYGDI